MTMNERIIANACKEVYRRFPEMRGTRPKIQPFGPKKNNATNPSLRYVLTFQGKGETETCKSLLYTVRVVVNSQGKILKMSMSR